VTSTNWSPCREHPCSAEHADLVFTFRSLVDLWNLRAEEATGGYETEMAAYRQDNPPPSFKEFLQKHRRK
jgi:hypothetical protein